MAFLMNYDLNPNIEGNNGFGRQPANTNKNLIAILNTQLAATTDTTLVVPQNIGAGRLANDKAHILAIISYASGAIVFVGVGGTAAPDVSGTFTAGNGVINPSALMLQGVTTLHFWATAQVFVSVEFYSVT